MKTFLDVATILSGFATLIISVLTVFLLRENRLLRKAGSEPRVVAHFDIHPSGAGAINLSLSNIGTGAALDVLFKIKADQEVFNQHGVQLDIYQNRAPMTLIAQGQKISFLFGVARPLFKSDHRSTNLPPFEVSVQWKDSGGRRFSQSYTLDISQYSGLAGMSARPPIYEVSQTLKKIEKHLSSISSWDARQVDLIDATKLEHSTRGFLISQKPPRSE